MTLWNAHQVSGNPCTSRIGDPVVPADDVVEVGPVELGGVVGDAEMVRRHVGSSEIDNSGCLLQ